MFLIRFYEELSYLADEPDPVADACRRTQLWLRDTQVEDMLSYTRTRTRLNEKTKLALIADIERFANASTAKGLYRGGTLLFKHFIYWGSFCVINILIIYLYTNYYDIIYVSSYYHNINMNEHNNCLGFGRRKECAPP